MIAIAAKEETPQQPKLGNKHQSERPRPWVLLRLKGAADFDTVLEALHWYEWRWRIERFFHTVKPGIHMEQRRLNQAEDRRKCRAFDAITAFRVWDLPLLAQTKPAALARK